MKSLKGSILVVEDDRNQRTIIKTILSKEGYSVEDVGTGKKALELLKNNVFDLVLTDLRLPDLEGTEILKEVKAQNRPCRVVIVTAYGSIPSAIEATKLGAFHYLEKPLEKDHLLIVVSNALNQVQLLRDNIMLKDQLVEKFQLENIVGDHGRMQELYRIVKKVAPTSTTVLIYGASGTGKELFAKSIHFNSPRKDKTFYAINCAAIPETLLESELFGYEKGAFTGAFMRHEGLFEQANGSTLFLDEIGDLTLTMQAKILRAIQEKEIRRVGGKETIKLDVRILAATNKRLEEEISKGRFRQDLYYRLNVIAFTIPPLAERMTDIPLLVEHFLKRLNEQNSKRIGITPQALQALMDYSWPGNIRQLESVIERSYIMCEGENIDIDHMPEEIKQTGSSSPGSGDLGLINDSLIDAKLTASEYRLYLYLATFDSAALLPDPRSIIERLGINRDTFFTAVGRLAELGLFDYRERRESEKMANGKSPK
jgi:two-component system, NtrC family, response regulator PilR